MDDIIHALIRVAAHLSIAEHKTGIIKLKFALSAVKEVNDPKLGALLSSPPPGIIDTKLSLLTRTITINYDPAIIPADLWEDLARAHEDPQLRAQVEERLKQIWKVA